LKTQDIAKVQRSLCRSFAGKQEKKFVCLFFFFFCLLRNEILGELWRKLALWLGVKERTEKEKQR
jgi:hypothetical protein